MRGILGLLLLLLLPSAQAFDGGEAQTFASISRDVVAVGETFMLDVEVIAPRRESVTIGIDQSAGEIEVVRVEPIANRTAGESGVVVLARRFVLRPLQPGVLAVPPLIIRVGGDRVEAPMHEVRVYGDANGFYQSTQSVLPVVAEGESFVRIGSAFLVAEDVLVTAYHVVVGTDRVRVQLPNGKQVTTRKVWSVDPVRDVAVLHIDPRAVRRAGVTPLPLAPPQARGRAGDPAFTAGWPDGAQQTSVGVRYADLHPVANETLWVSSNRVRPGDSGGPLLDREGRVIGVVTSGRTALSDTDLLVEDVALATDPRKALDLRTQRSQPFGLREVLDVHARAGARSHARVLELATSLTQPSGWRSGERERQVRALQNIASQVPHDPVLQFLLGSALDQLGDEERAHAAYRTAFEANENYFPAAYALGHHYFQQGEYETAESLFEQTRYDTPYATLSALGLARIYAAELRYAEAEAALHEVLRRDHRYAPALYLLGYCQLAQGRVDEAAALATRLEGLSSGWAERLNLHLRQPILQPVALAMVPPVVPREP